MAGTAAGPPAGAAWRVGALAVTGGLAGVAGLAFHRVFGWGPVVPVVAVAAVVPTLLSGLLSGPRRGARGWPLWVSLVLTVAGWLATTCLTLFRDRLADGSAPRAIGAGLRDSLQTILTTLLPAPDRPELLVLVQVAVWLAAFGGAELAQRTRLRAAPALPAVAVFGLALLLGVDGPGSNVPVAAALVLLAAALALVRPPSGGTPVAHPARGLLLGVPAVLALGGVALLAAPYLPVSGSPVNPRERAAAPPPQARDSVSPLDRISAWLYRPDQPMFTVRAGLAENWRLAVLDRFDGLDWSSSGTYEPTGSQVPAPATPQVARRTVRQSFTIQELPGVWVPAADRVAAVTGLGTGLTVDRGSGVVAAGTSLHAGQRYQVVSRVPEWTTDQLAAAVPAADPEARAALALPWGPGATSEPVELAAFRQAAQAATGGAISPIQQAAQLAQWFSTTGRYDVTAPPGHNYSQLAWFLCQNPTRAGTCQARLHGTSEQFATAYAVLARTLGLPTRIAVGFRPGADTGGGLRQVRSGDVLAWPEVKFTGLGWVPFYPTPERADAGSSDAVAAGETQQKLQSIQGNAATVRRGAGPGQTSTAPPPAPRTRPAATRATTGGTARWPVPVAAVAALAIGYLAAALLLPWLRRRRRRSGATPELRVTGAWRQGLEHLGDVGLREVGSLTAHEVVGFGAGAVGEPAARQLAPLADLVNRARFAAGSGLDPAAADQAWQYSDELGRLVARRTGRCRRLARRLHPRALRPPRDP